MLDVPPLIDRRRFLQLMSAALALAEGGCTRAPVEAIVPYATQPEGLVDGIPQFYATALTQSGYAHGVLVESQMGRPTKIEGNPAHPASLGSTGPIEQGRILEFWDANRSRSCLRDGQVVATEALLAAWQAHSLQWAHHGGRGVRLLRGASSSPSLKRQEAMFLSRLPEAQVHCHEAVDRNHVHAGARLAFGRAVDPLYRFDRARIVVSLDADFLGSMPGHVRHARDFASTRRPEMDCMSRLYCVECMPTPTGACADHNLPLAASQIEALAEELWESVRTGRTQSARPWLQRALRDLAKYRGESLVVAGDYLSPRVHHLAHLINEQLGNIGRSVEFIEPVCGESHSETSLDSLVDDIKSARVHTLLVLDCNPAYTAAADLAFGEALRSVPESIHCGLHVDETAALCRWHVPLAHELEGWSDACAYDGTVSIQQPLLAPLFGGHSVHEVMALLTAEPETGAHAIIQRTWRERFGGLTDTRWQEALRSGLIADSAPRAFALKPAAGAPSSPTTVAAPGAIELVLRPDPNLYDGRYAPIPWLQELPKTITQLTWDNAAFMSPSQAEQLQVSNEDLVELTAADQRLVAPVWVVSQHAPGAITLYLGGGRTRAGPIGTGCGVDAFRLRTRAGRWQQSVAVRRIAGQRRLANVQQHHRMEGRELVRWASRRDYNRQPDFARREAERGLPSMYPPSPRAEHAWGMSINLGSCIGCNACTIACQAENNIPTVGKEEVLRGRVMHWIRVDHYEEPQPEGQRTHFQPVPCMQCEHAPCEVVCPVEASVHDPEGINVQVYNRCVGTRFCSNNCPYKVRRFNFLQYSVDEPALNAQRNPEVTVRMRGVMEKCNYCLQRVVRARITADRENRRLQDGEVVTACQAVCPTQAIVFGDLQDPNSAVQRAKQSARNYALLGELNTRPRTTYLAKVTNPHDDDSQETP